MTNLVNIIIPFYNASSTLMATLASIEAQTYQNWKVILIDDGSTDESPHLAADFGINHPGRSIVVKTDNPGSGPAIGRNRGLASADGDYVICLDADDTLLPHCLEQRIKVMQQEPGLHWAVFNQYQCAPGEQPPFTMFNVPVKDRTEAIKVFLQLSVAWQTTAPIWRTEVLKQLEGFDETLYPSEDPDLHLRALLDNNLVVKFCTDLPPDCYYNVANKTGDKLLLFYEQSIHSKFRLLKKTVEYLPDVVSKQNLKSHYRYLRKGFFNLLNTFLLARLREHSTELKESVQLLQKAKVLSSEDILKIKVIKHIYTTDSAIIEKFKVRGLVHKLFLSN